MSELRSQSSQAPHIRPFTDPKTGSKVTGTSEADSISIELSARRTGMSFQRTRMSADRTLMSVIRTALSLITFGFTLYQFVQHIQEESVLGVPLHGTDNFGRGLVIVGVAMLVAGIAYHVFFMTELRRERQNLKDAGLIHAESVYPPSLTLIVAIVLLLLGLAAVASVIFGTGPFS